MIAGALLWTRLMDKSLTRPPGHPEGPAACDLPTAIAHRRCGWGVRGRRTVCARGAMISRCACTEVSICARGTDISRCTCTVCKIHGDFICFLHTGLEYGRISPVLFKNEGILPRVLHRGIDLCKRSRYFPLYLHRVQDTRRFHLLLARSGSVSNDC